MTGGISMPLNGQLAGHRRAGQLNRYPASHFENRNLREALSAWPRPRGFLVD
jgi:hypothetical protein